MEYDLRALDRSSRYKILGSCITPRPIAWITSQSADGTRNAAPFSFFNVLGDNPPIFAVGMVPHPEKRIKDTPANIRETGEFVVNLVDFAHAERMNLTSAEVPPEIDEIRLADLEFAPSRVVAPPRIATVPASFECKVLHYIETGEHQVTILAEVVYAHLRDDILLDAEKIRIDVPAMELIARLHGAGWYARQTDVFEMLRPPADEIERRLQAMRQPS